MIDASVLDGLDRAIIVRGSDVTAEPIDWRWHGWLAAGKLHILAGVPGTGKTALALAFAAAITTGGRWPDGSRAPQGNALIVSYEDDVADTLVPRLAAMGADVSRAWFLQGVTTEEGETRAFSASHDLPLIANEIRKIGDVALIIVDPIVSAMAAVDSHKNLEVRQALQPLADLAAQTRATVLGITHLAKGSSGRDPLERLMGSVAFGALARIVLGAAKIEDENGARRVIARIKSNISADDGGFHYELHPTLEDGIETVSVLWGDPLEGSARELLTSDDDADPTGTRDALSEARDFLVSQIESGTTAAKDIYRQAAEAGIAKRTLDRAKARLGIRASKTRFDGGWQWKLPDTKVAKPNGTGTDNQALNPEGRQGRHPVKFGTLGNLRSDEPTVDTLAEAEEGELSGQHCRRDLRPGETF